MQFGASESTEDDVCAGVRTVGRPLHGPRVLRYGSVGAEAMQRPGMRKDRREYNEAQELENLQRVFDRLDKKGDKKVR